MTRLLALAFAALSLLAAPAAASTPERFTVEVTGSGPDVVLIPGLASSREVWAETAAALSQTRRVHLLQVKGFAGEPAGPNAEGPLLAPLAAEIAAYLESLDRPAVIGHSMGGVLAMAAAARSPQAPSRILVVDALPFFSLLFGPSTTPEAVRPRADAARDALLAQSPEQFRASQAFTLATLTKRPEGAERALAWSVASDRRVMARAMHEIMVTDLRPELGRIAAPLSVVYAWDGLMPFPQAAMDALYRDAYAAAPGARLERVDGAFHFVMWDRPEAFARVVERFLSDAPQP